jgi:hypothetical protein
MKFKAEDVQNLKKGRDTEPTIILTDSDQEMGINESSDELILDESQSDTVLNLAGGKGGAGGKPAGEEEIVFSDSTEEFSISPHDSDPEAAIPPVEVPASDEDMGLKETDSDSALVGSRSAPDLSGISGMSGSSSEIEELEELRATTEAKPIRMDSADETFELIDDKQDTKGADDFIEVVADDSEEEDGAPTKTGSARGSARKTGASGRVSRSARLRAMQMKQRPSELAWSIMAMVGVIILVLPGSIMVNRIQGTTPEWVNNFAGNLRGIIGAVFEGMMG